MRIVSIDICCKLDSNFFKCLTKYLSRVKGNYSKILFGRKGSLRGEIYVKVKELLHEHINYISKHVLHVEPVNNEVCFGVMKVNEDKFYKLREEVITKKIESKL